VFLLETVPRAFGDVRCHIATAFPQCFRRATGFDKELRWNPSRRAQSEMAGRLLKHK